MTDAKKEAFCAAVDAVNAITASVGVTCANSLPEYERKQLQTKIDELQKKSSNPGSSANLAKNAVTTELRKDLEGAQDRARGATLRELKADKAAAQARADTATTKLAEMEKAKAEAEAKLAQIEKEKAEAFQRVGTAQARAQTNIDQAHAARNGALAEAKQREAAAAQAVAERVAAEAAAAERVMAAEAARAAAEASATEKIEAAEAARAAAEERIAAAEAARIAAEKREEAAVARAVAAAKKARVPPPTIPPSGGKGGAPPPALPPGIVGPNTAAVPLPAPAQAPALPKYNEGLNVHDAVNEIFNFKRSNGLDIDLGNQDTLKTGGKDTFIRTLKEKISNITDPAKKQEFIEKLAKIQNNLSASKPGMNRQVVKHLLTELRQQAGGQRKSRKSRHTKAKTTTKATTRKR